MEDKDPVNNETPFSKDVEKARLKEKMYAEIVEELNASSRIQELKSKYTISSVDDFISSYASEKMRVLEWGPKHVKWHEEEELAWLEKAADCLQEIQQKKLFDIQCMWRADKLDLEGIELCDDFTFWERDVLNCPFIPLITPDEVDLYISYLQSNNCEDQEWGTTNWQNYDDIKDAYANDDADINFPEWYDFYNGRKGTGVYMLYPDIRGDKEDFYTRLYQRDYNRKHRADIKEQNSVSENVEKRPLLFSYDSDHLRWFISTFEDKETLEFAELVNGFRSLDDYDMELDNDKSLLWDATEDVPVLPWHDWREALHRSANLYKRSKIIEAMPLAYQSYKMRISTGIPFELESHNKSFMELMAFLRVEQKNKIKQGRILNGELPDEI